MLDSLGNSLTSDAGLYKQMTAFAESDAYKELKGHRKNLGG